MPSSPPWKPTQLWKKNLDQNGLSRKKLEHFEIDQPKILISKNFENCHRNVHWKLYENEKDQKISITFFFAFSFNFQWKILDGNFRNVGSQNVHWKLYENENRKCSISNIFWCQLQVVITFFEINRSFRFFFIDRSKIIWKDRKSIREQIIQHVGVLRESPFIKVCRESLRL